LFPNCPKSDHCIKKKEERRKKREERREKRTPQTKHRSFWLIGIPIPSCPKFD
jgi:hypothetical protein